ncbi:MAG TPA: hypothetical protein VLX92_27645 [Kofleriaceae bacterium]|nr:hypothetical protein [Kofleriaceae bacterium]
MPVLALAPLMLAACVIPPSLSVGNQDAGVNSPPAITSVRSTGEELLQWSQAPFAVGSGTMTLSLLDTDLDDTLYVRIFVDYNNPMNYQPSARSQCEAGPSKTAQRTAVCPLNGLCQPTDVGVTRGMEVLVFDRQPDDAGSMTPLYQYMSDPAGLSTSRFYYLECESS